jgi:6-pyruvoyltetrahydropterin/6-carboxytetrahydropterin synthase
VTRVATIAKRFTFDAAHRLERLPIEHPCFRLHGHTYGVEIVLLGPIDDHTGFIVDYADIATAWYEAIGSRLDHEYLNNIPGLEVPSTENLVYWIMRELAQRITRQTMTERTTLLRAVRVKESSTTWCELDAHVEATGLAPWFLSDEAAAVMRRAR